MAQEMNKKEKQAFLLGQEPTGLPDPNVKEVSLSREAKKEKERLDKEKKIKEDLSQQIELMTDSAMFIKEVEVGHKVLSAMKGLGLNPEVKSYSKRFSHMYDESSISFFQSLIVRSSDYEDENGIAILKSVIDSGVNIHAKRDPGDMTPFLLAAFTGKVKAGSLLSKGGADWATRYDPQKALDARKKKFKKITSTKETKSSDSTAEALKAASGSTEPKKKTVSDWTYKDHIGCNALDGFLISGANTDTQAEWLSLCKEGIRQNQTNPEALQSALGAIVQTRRLNAVPHQKSLMMILKKLGAKADEPLIFLTDLGSGDDVVISDPSITPMEAAMVQKGMGNPKPWSIISEVYPEAIACSERYLSALAAGSMSCLDAVALSDSLVDKKEGPALLELVKKSSPTDSFRYEPSQTQMSFAAWLAFFVTQEQSEARVDKVFSWVKNWIQASKKEKKAFDAGAWQHQMAAGFKFAAPHFEDWSDDQDIFATVTRSFKKLFTVIPDLKPVEAQIRASFALAFMNELSSHIDWYNRRRDEELFWECAQEVFTEAKEQYAQLPGSMQTELDSALKTLEKAFDSSVKSYKKTNRIRAGQNPDEEIVAQIEAISLNLRIGFAKTAPKKGSSLRI